MKLNLRQIEAFRAVYQTGSMTVSAELIGVSQPAVSRLIRDLEAQVGFLLFDRVSGRLSATHHASVLFREVQRSFVGLERITQVAQQLRQYQTQALRVAATVGTSFYLLPKVIGRFRQRWPDIRLNLHSAPSLDVVDLVARQQVDLGIAMMPDDAAGVQATALPILSAVCLVPHDHELANKSRIALSDLDGRPLLMLADNSVMQQRLARQIAESGISLNLVLESSFSTPLAALVKQGLGIAVVDPLTARAYECETAVVRPLLPTVSLELRAIRPVAHPLGEAALALVAMVAEELTKQAQSMDSPL